MPQALCYTNPFCACFKYAEYCIIKIVVCSDVLLLRITVTLKPKSCLVHLAIITFHLNQPKSSHFTSLGSTSELIDRLCGSADSCPVSPNLEAAISGGVHCKFDLRRNVDCWWQHLIAYIFMLHHVVRVPKHPKWDVGTSCELILFLFQSRLCCACSDCHYAQLELLLSWNQFYFPFILHPAWHHCLAHISGHTYMNQPGKSTFLTSPRSERC